MGTWKLRELIVLSVLSVVCGVIYLLFFQVGNVLVGMFGLIGYDLIFGIWFLVSILAAYIIRKPGAAFLSETIAAFVEVLIGSSVGPSLIVAGMVQGLGAEMVFAATRYRVYTTAVLMLAGMGSSVTSFIYGYFISGFSALDPTLVTAMFSVRLISGALLAGLLGKWLSDSVAKTGALAQFALGKEQRKGSITHET
ncbi:ECF transporter S component [Bacillus fonticola]|uniref:ECF transporter S component n=1 Tax=Bacillus fonticola TaxID=2728853 RepID=UPI0014752375|nr:ECF transporter S component [Bacillus fonticola]